MTMQETVCSTGSRLAAAGRETLGALLAAPPVITISLYEHAIILRQHTPEGSTEYAISPQDLAAALGSRLSFSTGLLSGQLLYLSREGTRTLVVEYRRPQRTGLFLEGSENAVTVPLPGLVLLRRADQLKADYRLFAVRRRPTSLRAALFRAPLPNTYPDGNVCWGSVPLPAREEASLTPDWAHLLGSVFGSHMVGGKSREHPDDVRGMLLALDQARARAYPVKDLLPAGGFPYRESATLGGVIAELEEGA